MSNPLEAELHYPLGETAPAPGAAIEVAPGVRWLRMRLPFALDHINLWLLRDREPDSEGGREGWTVVDCGIADETTRQAWETVFANELDGLPVLRVLVTHMHPDHIGLAHWLCERWSTPARDCRLWISATDWNAGRMASQTTTGFGGDAAARFFARHGLTDPEAQAKVRARAGYYANLVPQVPPRFRRLMDGMALDIGGRRWRCIVGHGHAPEHISLLREGRDGGEGGGGGEDAPVLISGDMLLPRISTNVSVIDIEPEADPLPLFLRSIAALRALPERTLVLPSHGKPFTGLHRRVAQLEAHHAARLAELLAACAEAPRSAAELLPVLFRRPLDLHQTTFAMGEAIAHLHALLGEGRVQPVDGEDGVRRWRLSGRTTA
jgi:glyoxylase-like metal-dependent hydrolase (beta-lactamase superfamily II)